MSMRNYKENRTFGATLAASCRAQLRYNVEKKTEGFLVTATSTM